MQVRAVAKYIVLPKMVKRERFIHVMLRYIPDAPANGDKYVFAGDDSSSIYCFDRAEERLWKLGTGCGSAIRCNNFSDRLYLVTTSGYLTCIDVSESAIAAAQAGNIPDAVELKALTTKGIAPSNTLETTSA